jgi:hypothetical protein
MIKEETYNQVATEFATSIGVAHIIGFKTKRDQIKEEGVESFKVIEPDLEINAIVCDAIEFDLYKELQRKVYEIRQTKKKLKELTIYRRAFKLATEQAYSVYKEAE